MENIKEHELLQGGYKLIAGVDEAGRGPLAGPVIAAAVIFPADFVIEGSGLEAVTDSKKLSEKKRIALFSIIKEKALALDIAVVDHRIIDKINILQASLLAMKNAVEKLKVKPDYVLVDGSFIIPKLEIKQESIIDGDALVFCIAAASIVAKVSRDYLMEELDKKYPAYGFAKHKGYGTKDHMEALQKFGASPIHRRSFGPVKNLKKSIHR